IPAATTVQTWDRSIVPSHFKTQSQSSGFVSSRGFSTVATHQSVSSEKMSPGSHDGHVEGFSDRSNPSRVVLAISGSTPSWLRRHVFGRGRLPATCRKRQYRRRTGERQRDGTRD